MNLIGDPWVPVLGADGQAREVGLAEIYERGEEILDLAVQPLQRIALMRLLLCITHAALDGPKDEEEWRACRARIGPESLEYLRRRQDRFELYGERPFLQVAGLELVQNARLDKLDFGLAAGNNDTLYDHAANGEPRVHAPAWQALNLLVMQLFGQSSKATQVHWGGKLTAANHKLAPAGAESAMHALLRADSLLASVWLNMVIREDVSAPWGKPVWEVEIPHHESSQAEEVRASFLGRLVPLARGILLVPGATDFTLVEGLQYEKPPAGHETTATVVLKKRDGKQVPGYLSVEPSRHPWRDAPSVLALAGAGIDGGPPALRHLRRNPDLGTVDVWLGGLALERSAKLVDTAEWVFPVPCELIGDEALTTYEAGVKEANNDEVKVRAAVNAWWAELKKARQGQSGKHRDDSLKGYREGATGEYWSLLDARHRVLVDAACSADKDLSPWRSTVRAAMFQAYEASCPHTTPRQIQAFARGRRALYLKSERSAEEEDS
ncbi:MAG: type I-E CRISPR-associated protein Cse1/CasA [Candidatus Latescibacterota bacterium]|jgi:CRISPR system Cascade subunit CasA